MVFGHSNVVPVDAVASSIRYVSIVRCLRAKLSPAQVEENAHAMPKYEIAAMIVIKVVIVWKRRRDSGTVQDRAANAADARTIRTKTTLNDCKPP
jgi:hypothetical protein